MVSLTSSDLHWDLNLTSFFFLIMFSPPLLSVLTYFLLILIKDLYINIFCILHRDVLIPLFLSGPDSCSWALSLLTLNDSQLIISRTSSPLGGPSPQLLVINQEAKSDIFKDWRGKVMKKNSSSSFVALALRNLSQTLDQPHQIFLSPAATARRFSFTDSLNNW